MAKLASLTIEMQKAHLVPAPLVRVAIFVFGWDVINSEQTIRAAKCGSEIRKDLEHISIT